MSKHSESGQSKPSLTSKEVLRAWNGRWVLFYVTNRYIKKQAKDGEPKVAENYQKCLTLIFK